MSNWGAEGTSSEEEEEEQEQEQEQEEQEQEEQEETQRKKEGESVPSISVNRTSPGWRYLNLSRTDGFPFPPFLP